MYQRPGRPPILGVPAPGTTIGRPPPIAAPQVIQRHGQASVDGIALPLQPGPPLLRNQQQGRQAEATGLPPERIVNVGQFGEAITIALTFAAAGEVVALARPDQTRISLLIQNLSVGGNVFYCFDRQADNVSCIAIGVNGNRLFDSAVPQGELHLFSTGAGVVVVEYMNKSIALQ